ncbi:hypothetical protein ACKKBF_B15050 [Auxenochlorella protothecoides x Auxenochlorella symbiontica]
MHLPLPLVPSVRHRDLEVARCDAERPVPDPFAVLRAQGKEVQSICLQEDRGVLYAGHADGSLTVWSLESMRPVNSLALHDPLSGILGLIGDPGGKWIVSQGRSGPAQVHRADDLLPGAGGVGETRSNPVHIQREGDSFAAPALILPPSPDQAAAPLPGLRPGVPALVLPHAEGFAVACTGSGRRVVDVPSPQGAGMLTSLLACCAWSTRDGPHVLAGYESGMLALWRLAQPPAPLASCALSKQPLLALARCPARGRGVAAGPRAALLPFRLELGGKRESERETEHEVDQRTSAPTSDGSSHNDDHQWAEAAPRISRGTRVPLSSAGVNCLALRSDGRLLALGGWDGRVRVFAFPSLRPLASLAYHTESATCLAFGTPASGLLATGSRDGSIALYILYPFAEKQAGSEPEDGRDLEP